MTQIDRHEWKNYMSTFVGDNNTMEMLIGLSSKDLLWCKAWNVKCVQNWQIYPRYWHLVVKNGNFTLLLLELILADEVVDLLADLPPHSGI